MQYKIINGAVYYDSNMVLENIDIEINDNEKIAIVGRNGCGKTTLLKAIMGQVELEEGTGEKEFTVIKVGNPDISYLRQVPFEDESTPMVEEVRKVFQSLITMEHQIQDLVKKMEHQSDEKTINTFSSINERYIALGGLTYKKEYETMIRRFGFTDEDKKKPVSEFSGGQRTKIGFMKMLLTKPDILLLDEPTNHLDVETIEWLEEYLRTYKSTLVIVSHDRMFLDRIVNKVYEIEWGETKCYKGNYSAFEKQKRDNYIKQQKDHALQQAEIQRLTCLIERFRYKATKARMVQSKIKLLEHMQILAAPERYNTKTYKTSFQPKINSSRQVLQVSNLEIGYDTPLARVSFKLERGQKLGIIGGNGIGKSTLLKTLMGSVAKLSGEISFGYHTEIGYFDQQLAQIDGDETIFDLFAREFPELNDREVRTALGSFQFSGDDVFQIASSLSGGEKVRLTLCIILHKHPNVLILDEPTNHMDIIGKSSLEDILAEYQGTILFVSHDRYFIKKIADQLLIFHKDGVEYFPSTYDEYEEKRIMSQTSVDEKEVLPQASSKGTTDKYVSSSKELEKKRRRIEKIEQFMENCEEEMKQLDTQTNTPEVYTDYEKLSQVQDEIEKVKHNLSLYEEEWELLMQEIDGFVI